MPLLRIETNVGLDAAKSQALVARASEVTARTLGKPERYVMVTVQPGTPMLMAGTAEPAAFLELRSIGLPEDRTAALSNALCDVIERETGVPRGPRLHQFRRSVQPGLTGGGTAVRSKRSVLRAPPDGSVGAVLEDDAAGGEAVADSVGGGEIAVLAGGHAIGDQGLDLVLGDGFGIGGLPAEPRFRILPDEAEQVPGRQEPALEGSFVRVVGGLVQVRHQLEHMGKGGRRVEIVGQRVDEPPAPAG